MSVFLRGWYGAVGRGDFLEVLTNAPEKAMGFLFWIPISDDVPALGSPVLFPRISSGYVMLGWRRQTSALLNWTSIIVRITRIRGEVQGQRTTTP